MIDTFEVIADPTRRRVIEELQRGEASVGALVEALELSQPTVSKHLRVLRDAGWASARKDAQRRIYRLEARGLKELDEWLTPFRAFWEERVDMLERTLETMED